MQKGMEHKKHPTQLRLYEQNQTGTAQKLRVRGQEPFGLRTGPRHTVGGRVSAERPAEPLARTLRDESRRRGRMSAAEGRRREPPP